MCTDLGWRGTILDNNTFFYVYSCINANSYYRVIKMMVQKTSDQSLEDLPNHSGSSKDHSGPRSLTTGTKNKHNIEVTCSKLEDFCRNL